MKAKIYNKGKIEEMYDFLNTYLLNKGIILAPPARKLKEGDPNGPVGVSCYISEPKGLEEVVLNFDKKGWIFKKTEFSVSNVFSPSFLMDLLTAINNYAYEKGYTYKFKS